MFKRPVKLLVFFSIFFALGVSIALNPATRDYLSADFLKGWFRVGSLMRFIKNHYVDPVDYDTLAQTAVENLFSPLDSYSYYLSPDDFRSLHDRSFQEYVGIGVGVGEFRDRFQIFSVVPGSPADQSGVKVGDILLSVGGEPVEGMELSEVIARLTTEYATYIDIEVSRSGVPNPLFFSMIRLMVYMPTIEESFVDSEGIGYIRFVTFGVKTFSEFKNAISKLETGGLSGLIIDVRDNVGGVLDGAIDVGDYFSMGPGVLLTSQGKVEEVWMSSEEMRRDSHYPVVVLMNKRSASSSEILAGILRDLGGATLIGETTAGKGSIQSVYRWEENEGIRLTTARYSLPGGQVIDQVGLIPDIPVSEVGLREDGKPLRFKGLKKLTGPWKKIDDHQVRTGHAVLTGKLREKAA